MGATILGGCVVGPSLARACVGVVLGRMISRPFYGAKLATTTPCHDRDE